MRYDTPIYFQKLTPDTYDAESGNYVENEPIETQKYADVTDAGLNTLQIIYGTISEKAITIRLQRPYIEPFDYIRIENKRYRVSFSRGARTFIAKEVQ